MSYDIIYGKQFIKLQKTGEVIPMLLAGSNNCYEIGRGGRTGRRTRSWDNQTYFNKRGKISEKPNVILANVDAELRRVIRKHRGDDGATPSDIRNHFGYYVAIAVGGGRCGETSWNRFRSQYENGIRGAKTIEELAALGVYPCFTDCLSKTNGKPASVMIENERQYFEELKKWRAWSAIGGERYYLSFRPYDTDTIRERLRTPRKRTFRERQQVEQSHYFVLSSDGCYLKRYTRSGYRYSVHPSGGKKFMSKKLAERYRKELLAKGRYKAESWKVERINQKMPFYI